MANKSVGGVLLVPYFLKANMWRPRQLFSFEEVLSLVFGETKDNLPSPTHKKHTIWRSGNNACSDVEMTQVN